MKNNFTLNIIALVLLAITAIACLLYKYDFLNVSEESKWGPKNYIFLDENYQRLDDEQGYRFIIECHYDTVNNILHDLHIKDSIGAFIASGKTSFLDTILEFRGLIQFYEVSEPKFQKYFDSDGTEIMKGFHINSFTEENDGVAIKQMGTLITRAEEAYQDRDYPVAIDLFTRALKRFPQYSYARYYRAASYMQKNNRGEEISTININLEAAKTDLIELSHADIPIKDLIYSSIGECFLNEGNNYRAIAYFDSSLMVTNTTNKALVLDARAVVLSNRARALIASRNFKESLKDIEAAILQLEENSKIYQSTLSHCYVTKARALIGLKEYSEAESVANKAIRHKNPYGHFTLALVHANKAKEKSIRYQKNIDVLNVMDRSNYFKAIGQHMDSAYDQVSMGYQKTYNESFIAEMTDFRTVMNEARKKYTDYKAPVSYSSSNGLIDLLIEMLFWEVALSIIPGGRVIGVVIDAIEIYNFTTEIMPKA